MRSLLLFILFSLGQIQCEKSRSVNLALETIFEFNNESDLVFVNTVQDFLNKVKFTLEESYRRDNVQTRRINSLTFTDFIEDTINVLRSYNDIDLSYFIELLDSEINKSEYEECEITVTKGFGLRRYLADRLSEARDIPASEIKRNLDDILREIKNKKDKKSRILYSFLNSIVKRHSQVKFKRILDDLQLYRRRQMDPTMNLRTIVQNSIGSMITDYICNLNNTSRQKLKNILKLFTSTALTPEAETNKNLKNKNIRLEWKENKNKPQDIDKESDEKLKKETKDLGEDSYHESVEKYSARDSLKERVRQQKYKNNKGLNDYENKNNYFNNIMNPYRIKEVQSLKRPKKRRNKVKVTKNTKSDLKLNYEDSKELEIKHPLKNKKSVEKTTKKLREKNIKTTKHLDLNTESSENTENSDFYSKESKEKYTSSDDSISVTHKNKKLTKKPKHASNTKRLKTFVTLYPEKIQINMKTIGTHRKRKITTNIVRKRFTVKYNNEKNLMINITENDKILKTKHSSKADSRHKRFKIKANPPTIKRRKSKNSKTTKIETKFDSEENLTTSVSASFQNEGQSVEHFGSLYQKNNNKYSDVFYQVSNGYRKSNSLDKVTTPGHEENTVLNPTNTINMIETEKRNKNGTTTTKTTKTFGTLAFWGGTKKTTINRNSSTSVNLTETTSTQTTAKVTINNTEIVTKSNLNDTSNTILFRSQVLNKSEDIENIKNDTKLEKSINVTNFKFGTIAPLGVTNTKNYTNITETYKEVDLRRLLDSSAIINEIQDESKKKEIDDRFKEDLKKIFLPTVGSIGTNSSKDPIEEIEDAFNIS